MNSIDDANAQDAHADSAYVVLGCFDALCQHVKASYFLIGESLVGALCYGKRIPEGLAPARAGVSAKTESDGFAPTVGMLRSEFEKVRKCLKHVSQDGRSCGLEMTSIPDKQGLFTIRESADAGWNPPSSGKVLIAVYDEVTNDYDLTRFQLFRIRKLRKLAAKPGPARAALEARAWAVAGIYNGSGCAQVANLLGGDDKMLDRNAVARTQRVAFGPLLANVPRDSSAWYIADASEESRRIRAVQRDSLAALREVDRICRQNGIGYFLCAGTLLGAVRYGGFIPWDDDVDVGMLRDDYQRFLECAPSQLSDRFFLQTRDTDPAVPYLYSKVRVNGTEYVTSYTESRNMHKGISLDIFPFDYAPVRRADFESHLARANELIRAHKSRAARQVPEDMPSRPARGPFEAFGHAIMAARHRHYNALSTAETHDAYVAHVSKFLPEESTHAASYVAYFTCIPLDDLLPLAEMEFEGQMFFAPRNPDPLLRMQFGDYLAEPAPHLRRGHAVLRWRASSGESS